MSTTKPKSPYSCSLSVCGKEYSYNPIETEYELQYNKDHIVEKVAVGEVDISKEIDSHKDEVGLINAVRLAIAHGEDPLTKFGKYNRGGPSNMDPNITLDQLNEDLTEQTKKYQDIADSLGVSIDELKNAIQNGTLNQLIENKAKADTETEVKDNG